MVNQSVVSFGGSRGLSPLSSSAAALRAVVGLWVAGGSRVQVGCATGADALVVQACLAAGVASQLSVFAAFDQFGEGSCSVSAVAVVAAAAAAGARVSYLAGGSLAIPLVARLARRSQAALVGSQALVLFLASPVSPGSLSTAAAAVAQGIGVFAFCPSQPCALRSVGSWVPGAFCCKLCWVWSKSAVLHQPALF